MTLVVAQGASWKYKVVAYTDTTNRSLESTATWSTAATPFGNNAPENGLWPNGQDLWLQVSISQTYKDLSLKLSVEDHCDIYVNGTKIVSQPVVGSGIGAGDSVWSISNSLLNSSSPNIIAIRAMDEQPPAGDTHIYVEVYSSVFWTAGVGNLTASGTTILYGSASQSGSGLLEAFAPQPNLTLEVLDKELDRAPTTVTVTLTDAQPDTTVVFDIDGTVVYTTTTDSYGNLDPTSLPVPPGMAAGTHTVTATQPQTSGSDTFTLARDPVTAPSARGTDTDPIEIPEAVVGTVRRWVFQDLMPGGLGSYVLPNNPSKMSAPHVQRELTSEHTTAQDGQFHVFENSPQPVQWTFSGYCGTQEFHDQLVAYHQLNRRFYVIDHRDRAWKVTFVDVDIKARRRQTPRGGVPTDWGADYTVTALIYDQNWRVPV